MTDRVGKPPPPTDEDWRAAIDNFKRYRGFDTKRFRDNVDLLIDALQNASDRAYAAAARIERRQLADLSKHNGKTITDGLIHKGYAEQLDLANLELLRLVPIEPWLEQADPYGMMAVPPFGLVVFGDLDDEKRERFARMAEQLQCWGLDMFARPIGQRQVRLLRLQAERLLEGMTRVQLCAENYRQRLKAIKQTNEAQPSVALHELFTTTEPWDVDVGDIARRLVDAKVLPDDDDDDDDDERDPKDLVAQWHESLRRRRQEWRKKWAPKRRGAKSK